MECEDGLVVECIKKAVPHGGRSSFYFSQAEEDVQAVHKNAAVAYLEPHSGHKLRADKCLCEQNCFVGNYSCGIGGGCGSGEGGLSSSSLRTDPCNPHDPCWSIYIGSCTDKYGLGGGVYNRPEERIRAFLIECDRCPDQCLIAHDMRYRESEGWRVVQFEQVKCDCCGVVGILYVHAVLVLYVLVSDSGENDIMHIMELSSRSKEAHRSICWPSCEGKMVCHLCYGMRRMNLLVIRSNPSVLERSPWASRTNTVYLIRLKGQYALFCYTLTLSEHAL